MLSQRTTFYGCAVLATFAASLPQSRGEGKVSLALSLDVPTTVNGVSDFTITGKLKNDGTQDVLVVRDPGGILYQFFTADALIFERADSKEKDPPRPSFVGYSTSWDMKTYLNGNIKEDKALPKDHEAANTKSRPKRASPQSQGLDSDSVGESEPLSDTDSSVPGSSKSGDKKYPPGTTFALPAGETVTLDYKAGNVYDFTTSGAGAYTLKLKQNYFYVLVDDEISQVEVKVKGLDTVNIQGKLKGKVPKPNHHTRDLEDGGDDTELNRSIVKRRHDRRFTVTTRGCTQIQAIIIDRAAQEANKYAKDAYNYVSSMTGPTDRYTTWFGDWNTPAPRNGWRPRDQVTSMFKSIVSHSFLSASDAGGYIYDCTCQETINGYIENLMFPPDASNPAIIFLCEGFRSIEKPMSGYYSKAGVLIHEATHFKYHDPPCRDWAYWPKNCHQLAIDNAFYAATNADSYQLFTENQPPLP